MNVIREEVCADMWTHVDDSLVSLQVLPKGLFELFVNSVRLEGSQFLIQSKGFSAHKNVPMVPDEMVEPRRRL